MKKLLLITGVILIAYLLFLSAQTPRPTDTAQTAAGSGAPYTVREYQGYVAVFEKEKEPHITDTAVASLPQSDRGKLKKGISIYSEKELKALLEDLCS